MPNPASAIGYQPATRTVAQIIASVRRTFGDDTGVQILDTDIIAWINDAQDVIVNRNKILKAKTTGTTVIGQSDYQFTTASILSIDSVLLNGDPLPNTPIAQAQELDANPTTSGNGTPATWWEWGGTLTLFPPPSVAGVVLTIFYTMLATRVASSTDLLSVPDRYYQSVLQYVLAQAYELDENYAAMGSKMGQFQQMLDSHGDDERTAQYMRYDTITLIDGDY